MHLVVAHGDCGMRSPGVLEEKVRNLGKRTGTRTVSSSRNAGHADDKSTSSFRPTASAHLCSVAIVGFSILPVSKRDKAGGSIPIRSATSASVNPWLRASLPGK